LQINHFYSYIKVSNFFEFDDLQASGLHKPQNELGKTIFFLIAWIKNN